MWQGTRLDLIPSVQVDNRLGTRIAVEHLIGLGHERIAFIGGRLLGDIRERQAAYTEAVSPILGEIPRAYLQHVANTPEGGEAALGALLRLSPRPTAIVASTDVLAIGVLRGALLRGVQVPDELSVVGFDDIPMAKSTVPGLTTIRMPIAAMAAEAVALAVGQNGTEPGEPGTGTGTGTGLDVPSLRNGRGSAGPGTSSAPAQRRGASTVRVFPPSLVIRQSTGAPPVRDVEPQAVSPTDEERAS